MTSLILSAMARLLLPLLVLFSIFLLFRGHNYPGGGFAGGLVAAAAIALYAIAYDVRSTRRVMPTSPRVLTGAGLLLAVASGVVPLASGQAFMTGRWVSIHLKDLGEIHIGTPLLFDAGVYLVVVGVTLTLVLALAEED